MISAAVMDVVIGCKEKKTNAAYLGDRGFGIVHTRKGWAVRVLKASYKEIVAQLKPEDLVKLTSDYYEVSGVPINFSKTAVQRLLSEGCLCSKVFVQT